MYIKKALVPVLAIALAAAPLAADAHGWHGGRGGGGLIFGLGAAVGALAVGAATIVAAPINAVAGAPYYYNQQPAYYAPAGYQQPAPYYQPQPYYQQPAYYPPQQAYGAYAPAPYYYPPQQAYYYR